MTARAKAAAPLFHIELFAHLCAALPTAAARAVHPLIRDDHGDHRFPLSDADRLD